ncbi:MAG: O-methyltransferase [Saprospiraceae bacterium]|nr:O-methyltransferase [Saprospiraceae bacterium]
MLQDNYTRLYDYCVEHSTPMDEILYELDRETHLKTLAPRMSSGPIQGRILSLISNLLRPKYILEIGTFTGFATLNLVRGLQPDGELITVEVNAELQHISHKYFTKSGYSDRINQLIGNAKEIVPKLDYKFDLIFLDAGKKDYPIYYELILPKLRKGGIILADNILWSGKILDENMDKTSVILDEFNKQVVEDSRVENVILPLRDGINVIRKL